MIEPPVSMHSLTKVELDSTAINSTSNLYNQNSQSPETIVTLECSSRSPSDGKQTSEQSTDNQRMVRTTNGNWEPLTPPQ